MAGTLHCSKSKNKGRLRFSSIETAEIRHFWGFILLNVLKKSTAGVLIYLKC